MDCERKINLIEGVPLNTAEKSAAPDVGVHINTTFSIASSKKIKLLFVLNFLLTVLCMVVSCSVAFYCWSEVAAARRQADALRDQLLLQSLRAPPVAAAVSAPAERGPRLLSPNTRKYYVEDLGDDMLLVDSSKKSPNRVPDVQIPLPVMAQKELLVIHFNGAQRELNLGSKAIIGPWSRDNEVSSKNNGDMVELHTDYVTIKEGGLYLVYAQIAYLTHAPNCYFIWARAPEQEPRLLGACAGAGDTSLRPLDKSQITCGVQTIARLHKGDIVNLAQREHNRTLWLRPGYSYFGFVKLSS